MPERTQAPTFTPDGHHAKKGQKFEGMNMEILHRAALEYSKKHTSFIRVYAIRTLQKHSALAGKSPVTFERMAA